MNIFDKISELLWVMDHFARFPDCIVCKTTMKRKREYMEAQE